MDYHGMSEPSRPPPLDDHHRIERLIRSALEPYGQTSAAVEMIWSDGYEGWSITVTPARIDAARMEVGVDRWGGLLVVVANSSMDTDLEAFPFSKLTVLAEHVFAGRV